MPPALHDRAATIAVAPDGGRRAKIDHAAIPLTPADLARRANACQEAGAAMIHVHVRKNRGGYSS
ncbi:3-keto-5-aminohexanoate cleavage protein [Nguyenibacter sp. L1]|uniref:3-keto-5-aminohexanoate cleavage protein n=1 Tax=Nguyenibacter sp. L1 TaxID=3049350 RepID=UPI0038D1B3A1